MASMELVVVVGFRRDEVGQDALMQNDDEANGCEQGTATG